MYKAYSNTNYTRALLVILFAFVLKNSDAKTEHSKPTKRTLAIHLLVDELQNAAKQSQFERLQLIETKLLSHGEAIIDPLVSLLSSANVSISRAAAETLESLGTKRALDEVAQYALKNLVAKPRNSKIMEGPGYDRLIKLGINALPAMTHFLKIEDENYRTTREPLYIATLMKASARLPNRSGLSLLEAGLCHRNPFIVSNAADGYYLLLGDAAFERLISTIKYRQKIDETTFPAYEHTILSILRKIGNKDAVEPLLKFLIELGPEPTSLRWRMNHLEKPSLHRDTIQTIDLLIGFQSEGNIGEIEKWIKLHRHSGAATIQDFCTTK